MKTQTYDYIVSFYLLERRSAHYSNNTKNDMFFLLKRHLNFLSRSSFPNLNKIYLVFNIDYVDRFDQKQVTDITDNYPLDINLIFRENKGLSYGAWNHALIENISKGTSSQYAFLCEDDYIPTTSEFHKPFFKQFKKNKNVGYVAQLLMKFGSSEKIHAAISNGFISYKIAQKVYNKHNQLFDIWDDSPKERAIYNMGVHNQLFFLDLLIGDGYDLEDIAEECCQPFYELRVEGVELYGNPEGPVVIEPILSSIYLTPLTKSDLPFLLEVRNDPSTRKFLGNDSVFTLEECEKWFETLEAEWFIIKYNDINVGYMRTTPNGEVGLDIHPKHRRKGYARMAYKEYLKYRQFATLWVFEDNFAKSLYEELGFIPTGNNGKVRGRDYFQMFYYNSELYHLSETPSKPINTPPKQPTLRRAQR